MSHAAIAHAPTHRSPTAASVRPQTAATSASGGSAPAGLFALLLRGQQGEADPAAEATREPEAGSQDTAQDSPAERPEAATGEPGAPVVPPAPAPTPAPEWLPTVRGSATAEPSAPADASDALQRLGVAGRGRAAAAHDALERSAEPESPQETAATERPGADAREPGRWTPAEGAAEALVAPVGPEPLPETAPAHPAAGTLPSLGAASDTAPAAPTAPSEPPATARAHLPQPPTSPAFAPALGLQISTWLREGVQHAALELNPAELGPIDVRIALRDGQAQVALAADVPFTRQALADALPQLAEALGEVGVHLAGGDVSDQSGRRARDEMAAAPQAGGAAAPLGGQASPAPAPAGSRRRGLLDLYA